VGSEEEDFQGQWVVTMYMGFDLNLQNVVKAKLCPFCDIEVQKPNVCE
jgi:hypothetical protein